MKTLRSALSALSLLLCHPVLADEQQVIFAIPETTGLVSLGAFDSQGRLVAALSEAEPTSEFTPDLNGLRIVWKGEDASGQPVPAGDYTIRGWLVADAVQVEGLAYRFNDWVETADSPHLHRVNAILPLKGQALAVLATDASSQPGLWREEGEDTPLGPKRDLPGDARLLAANSDHALFATDKALLLVPLDGSESREISAIIPADAPAVLGSETVTFATEADGQPTLRRLTLKDGSPAATIPTPAPFTSLTTVQDTVAGSDGEKVWLLSGDSFREIPLGDSPEVLGLSPGPGETFWLLTRTEPTQGPALALLRQYDLTGNLLREFATESEAAHVRAFTDPADLRIFVIDTRPTAQVTRGLHPKDPEASEPPQDTAPRTVDWEVFLDKTITDSSAFGLKDGQLVPDIGDAPLDTTLKVHLAESRLEKQPPSLTLKAVSSTDGIWLEDEHGLRLIRIADLTGAARISLSRGSQPDEAIIAIGDNAVVAEYKVTGLRKIFALDAGTVHLP